MSNDTLLPLDLITRFTVALVLGGIIGLERQWHQRTAGIRTNALVCIGACGFVIFATFFPYESSPTRIAAQVVSGIGFLGAGVIMREGLTVRGLNSAATIWCSSTVGVYCGGGYYLEASIIAGAVMITNFVLRNFVYNVLMRFLPGAKQIPVYILAVACHLDHSSVIRQLLKTRLKEAELTVKGFDSFIEEEKQTYRFIVTLLSETPKEGFMNDLVHELSFNSEVVSAEWENATQEVEGHD
jgi:putative Mg2+ transporter-C (MgtC) family protein